MTRKKILLTFLAVFLGVGFAGSAWAETRISITVKTVLASRDATFLDPRIPDLTRKLQSVFRYSSYRLLSEDTLKLEMGQTGKVSLPGDRVLKITPLRIIEDRVELRMLILKKKKQVIKSTIQILNRGSIVVGGPEYKGGFLLFDISNAF